ncbi:hypothetical protein HOE04_01315 [archaeon]|jgi:hypothetical protein|nr:hypothetical protein [archaeon]
MTYVSEKLKEHKYLIPCLIEDSGINHERRVIFPCYNSNGKLGVETIVCHPDHVDEDKGLCRTDFLRWNGEEAIVDMNKTVCRIHKDSLIENLIK